MAAAQKFINDGLTTLAVACDDIETSLTVADATVFPAISGDEFFKMTLAPATTETTYEVVKVTAVAGNVLTVVRGVEGTAQAWSIGAKAENRLTAADITAMFPDGAALKNVLYVTTGSQNNWSPTGLHGSAYIIVTASSDPTIITGIDSSFAVDGTLLVIENIHATNGLYLAHASGSSSVLNNFDFQAAEDYYLTRRQRVLLIRVGSKWRDFSPKYLVLTDLGTAALEDTIAFDPAGAAASAQAASQPLNTLLTAIAALATTGLMAVTGAGTTALRTITGTANQVIVGNGDGVAGNPTLSLPQDIHTGASPTFAAVTAGTFTGNLSGNATTATTATTATNAVNSGITDDTSTNATMYPVWVTAATGNLPLKVSSTDLTWNPSTNTFALTGGPYTNTQAVAATSTDGLVLATSATATSGNHKKSPRFRFLASGYDGTALVARSCEWTLEVSPGYDGSLFFGREYNPLCFSFLRDGGAATTAMFLTDIGGGGSGPLLIIGTGYGSIGGWAYAQVFSARTSSAASTESVRMSPSGLGLSVNSVLGWRSGTDANVSSADTILGRGGVANLRFGAAAANPPVAQTLSVQGASGTNIAGAVWTFTESYATGTAKGGGYQWRIGLTLGTGTTSQSTSTMIAMDLGVTTYKTLTFGEAINIATGTTTGTIIGTASTQKLGFYGATPIVQGASVADATGGVVIDAEARTAINALISRIEALGLIATV